MKSAVSLFSTVSTNESWSFSHDSTFSCYQSLPVFVGNFLAANNKIKMNLIKPTRGSVAPEVQKVWSKKLNWIQRAISFPPRAAPKASIYKLQQVLPLTAELFIRYNPLNPYLSLRSVSNNFAAGLESFLNSLPEHQTFTDMTRFKVLHGIA